MEGRDSLMLLTQLTGCLMDVPVPVMDCYRPNSVPDESGLALSLLSLPLQDFL